ncbi:MAG: hypothetical protein IJ642_13965 [Oscillospiraceae bacterium]|nr:hypothetical protein [Oscillospiraceae bacterium]
MILHMLETLPVTEDSRNIVLWVILAVVAAVLIGVNLVFSAKKKKQEDDDDDDDDE